MAFLRVMKGPLKGQVFEIPDKDRVTVGRHGPHDVKIKEPSISRKHFAIEKRKGALFIVDLGSLNGTKLNGHRISSARLEHGDVITAGNTEIRFEETGNILEGFVPPPKPRGATAPEAKETPEAEEIPEPEEIPETEEPPRPGEDTRRGPPAESGGGAPTMPLQGAGSCAACGAEITEEQIGSGEVAKTRLGFVCSKCVELRQSTGEKSSLEEFIRERRKKS